MQYICWEDHVPEKYDITEKIKSTKVICPNMEKFMFPENRAEAWIEVFASQMKILNIKI